MQEYTLQFLGYLVAATATIIGIIGGGFIFFLRTFWSAYVKRIDKMEESIYDLNNRMRDYDSRLDRLIFSVDSLKEIIVSLREYLNVNNKK